LRVASLALVGLVIATLLVLAADRMTRRTDAAPTTGSVAPAVRSTVAYTFMEGDVVKLSADTGRVLARRPHRLASQGPSLAVSRDGQAVFVLDSGHDGTRRTDHLTVLAGDALTPQLRVPAPDYAIYQQAWPPALAVAGDDRTVAVYHFSQDGGENASPWLTYFDRQAGAFAADKTLLPGCGPAQLLPTGQQFVVVCLRANNVRLVDVPTRQVTGTIALSQPRAGNRAGWVVAGGLP
jgi:hypothetical protein